MLFVDQQVRSDSFTRKDGLHEELELILEQSTERPDDIVERDRAGSGTSIDK